MNGADPNGGEAPRPRSTTVPPEAWEPVMRVARLAALPLERFFRIEAASGIVLFGVAALALAWANSPWGGSYEALWKATVGFRLGGFSFERSLAWVVNDGLMTIFFFVAGMEIRRELHHGELSEPRRAAVPLLAALGGMAVPAAIYLALAGGPETRAGWGVPMATDIAFAIGVFALLGRRVPASLRVLLLTLAVVDDLGAIVVVAIFYSHGFSLAGLLIAAAGVGGIFLLRWLGVRSNLAYVAPAAIVWAGTYASGVHPTIAGVVVGLLTPVRAWREGNEPLSPAEHLIGTLHPWVAFGIMPLFALANAGVAVDASGLSPAPLAAAVAIAAGLVVGKPVGIVLAAVAAVKLGGARMPDGICLPHLVVLGAAGGVGFTMSLFIAQLAFADPPLLAAAKIGVLAASAIATVAALALGGCLLRPTELQDVPRTADEAECW